MKLSEQQAAIMGAILGISNAGKDVLFTGHNVEFPPAKMATFTNSSCESIAWSVVGTFAENDAMVLPFIEEALSWENRLKRMTIEKIRATWPTYSAHMDAIGAK